MTYPQRRKPSVFEHRSRAAEICRGRSSICLSFYEKSAEIITGKNARVPNEANDMAAVIGYASKSGPGTSTTVVVCADQDTRHHTVHEVRSTSYKIRFVANLSSASHGSELGGCPFLRSKQVTNFIAGANAQCHVSSEQASFNT
jgi:hypothetical protein